MLDTRRDTFCQCEFIVGVLSCWNFSCTSPSLRSSVAMSVTLPPMNLERWLDIFRLRCLCVSGLFVLCCFDFLCSFLICLPSLCLCLNPHEPSKATEFFQLVFVIFQVGAFSPSLLHHEAPEELCAWMTHKIQNSGFHAGIIKMGTMGKMCFFVILDCDEEKRATMRVYIFLIFKEWNSGALFWDSRTAKRSWHRRTMSGNK